MKEERGKRKEERGKRKEERIKRIEKILDADKGEQSASDGGTRLRRGRLLRGRVFLVPCANLANLPVPDAVLGIRLNMKHQTGTRTLHALSPLQLFSFLRFVLRTTKDPLKDPEFFSLFSFLSLHAG